MEVLRVSATITLRDLAELEHYKNLKEVHLSSLACPHVENFLPMLKRCTNLRRLTLAHCKKTFSPVLARELCDFIMELKDLTFVQLKHSFYPAVPTLSFTYPVALILTSYEFVKNSIFRECYLNIFDTLWHGQVRSVVQEMLKKVQRCPWAISLTQQLAMRRVPLIVRNVVDPPTDSIPANIIL